MKKINEQMHSLAEKIKWGIYDLKIKLFKNKKGEEKASVEKSMSSIKKRENVFLFFFLLFPMVQFAIFYFGVNINSILLSLQSFDSEAGFYFSGFNNFGEVISDIFVTGELGRAIKNSFIQFALGMFIGTPIHIMVAYAVFKKIPFSNFFKVMLFMPNMISGMVYVICGRYLIQNGFPILFSNPDLNLLNKYAESSFYTVLLFGFWMQFAGGLIIYLSAMASISVDVIEYGKLEKLSSIKELWYVIIPLIFPTITTYIVVGLAGFFTNYGFFYSFFGGGDTETMFDTLGYVFFVRVIGDKATQADYPYAAAGGLLFTAIIAPITIGVKTLLEKYGPSEE